MALQQEITPARYEQPVRNFTGRSLDGSHEYVDFVPESHLRIWYNNQTEGYVDHYHSAMEIIVCIAEQYSVFANNRTYLLNVGDILIIPPFMLHEIARNTSGARFIFLISTDILNCFKDFKILDTVFMEPYLCNNSSHSEVYQKIYNYLIQMTDIYFSNNSFWEISIYSLFLNVMTAIGQNHFCKSAGSEDSLSSLKCQEYQEIFTNLLNYIDAHFTEDLTLEQTACVTGFSKYHFSRLFKQYTNTTFYNYLCHKRIQASQFMLTIDMTAPVTDIAFRVGFNNLTSFCRCFKKYVNCSPSEYRNRFRHEEVF